MRRALVVGATGQLGHALVRGLVQRGCRVRALVRPSSLAGHALDPACEVLPGDLRDPASLLEACAGIDVVLATATVVFPKGDSSFEADEGRGYEQLIAACLARGVQRVVYVSLALPFAPAYLRACPTFAMKARVENLLRASGLEYQILACTPFMDDYFALIGSELPLRGEVAATLSRARGATRWMRRLLGRSIDRWSAAVVPGPAARRHAFVAVADVARAAIGGALDPSPQAHRLTVAGPESLSWGEVAGVYSALFERPVRVICLPATLLLWASRLLRPWSAFLSNQLAILWILAHNDTPPADADPAHGDSGSGTRAYDYLRAKLALGAGAGHVV